MIQYEWANYCRMIDFVLNYLQFEESIVKNNLDKQVSKTNQFTNN